MSRPFTFILTAALTLSAVAHADIKLGYVDLQRALQEVAEGKDARARLKTELDKKKADFEAEQAKLRDDKAVLDKQGSMMSEEVRNQKFTELQKRLFELTQRAEKLQAEMASSEQKELKKIFEKMDPIIAAIAVREQLTMVFEKTDSGLVYAPASLDVTNELVRTYNDKYKVVASAAPKKEKEGAAPKKDAPAPAPTPAPAAVPPTKK